MDSINNGRAEIINSAEGVTPVNENATIIDQQAPSPDKIEKVAEQMASPENVSGPANLPKIEREEVEHHIIGGQIPEAIQQPVDASVVKSAQTENDPSADPGQVVSLHDQAHVIKNSHVTGNDVASGLFLELERLKKAHQGN